MEQGEFTLGELVVPRKYKKMILDETGCLKEDTYTVVGRKIPLLEIRRREMTRLQKAGVVRERDDEIYENMPDEEVKQRLQELHEHLTVHIMAEQVDTTVGRQRLKEIERTRHLRVWGDNSTVLNHGHYLMMVSTLYDEAIFYTSAEMQQNDKGLVDVQQVVERPHVYILGRCSSSEVEQVAYVPTRVAKN